MQLKDQGKCNQDSLKKKIKCHGKGENLSQKTCERIRNTALVEIYVPGDVSLFIFVSQYLIPGK